MLKKFLAKKYYDTEKLTEISNKVCLSYRWANNETTKSCITYRFSLRAFKCTSAYSSVPKNTVLQGGAVRSLLETRPWIYRLQYCRAVTKQLLQPCWLMSTRRLATGSWQAQEEM